MLNHRSSPHSIAAVPSRPYGVPGWPSMQILCSRHPVPARGTHNAVQRAHAASFASTKRMTANQTEHFVMPKTTSRDANTATTALLTVTRPADLKRMTIQSGSCDAARIPNTPVLSTAAGVSTPCLQGGLHTSNWPKKLRGTKTAPGTCRNVTAQQWQLQLGTVLMRLQHSAHHDALGALPAGPPTVAVRGCGVPTRADVLALLNSCAFINIPPQSPQGNSCTTHRG